MARRLERPEVEGPERPGAYREARRKGLAWLLSHLTRDGSIGDPSTGFSYYRAPWTFTVVGETEAATGICAWIRRNLVTADGRIDGPYRVFDEWATYRDATLVVGAQLASQYDLSVGLWPGLLALRDPKSGLFANYRLPGGVWGGICAAFLCRMYQADPRPEYLALARRYQDFAIGSSDAQFTYPAACKGSWGASLLWQLTGEPRYEAFTFRMGDWYVDRQEPQ